MVYQCILELGIDHEELAKEKQRIKAIEFLKENIMKNVEVFKVLVNIYQKDTPVNSLKKKLKISDKELNDYLDKMAKLGLIHERKQNN